MFGFQERRMNNLIVTVKFSMRLVLLTLLMDSMNLVASSRPSFDLSKMPEGFSCENALGNRGGAGHALYGYHCLVASMKDENDEIGGSGEKKVRKFQAVAIDSFHRAQKGSTHSLVVSVSTFLEGLTWCGAAFHTLCGKKSCAQMPSKIKNELKRNRFCQERQALYDAVLNVDFQDLRFVSSQQDRTTKLNERYEQCVDKLLVEDYDRLCHNGAVLSHDREILEDFVAKEVTRVVPPLFTDISSPYYALFNTKLQLAKNFTQSSGKKIDQLFTEKNRLLGVLGEREQRYQDYFYLMDPMFKKYLNLNTNITRDENKLKDFTQTLLPPNTINDLEEHNQQMVDVKGKLNGERMTLGQLDQSQVLESILKQGVEFCKIYFCHLNNLPHLKFKRLCGQSHHRDHPMCLGKVKVEGQWVGIKKLCNELAPDLKSYWQVNITNPEIVKQCLTSF
jgi:hypothetical protein